MLVGGISGMLSSSREEGGAIARIVSAAERSIAASMTMGLETSLLEGWSEVKMTL